VAAGQSPTFIATATNECGGGLFYQWQFNGTNLDGATTNSLTLANVQPSDAGSYSALITNLGGSSPAPSQTDSTLAAGCDPPTLDFGVVAPGATTQATLL